MISKIKVTAYLVILCLVAFLLSGLSVSAQETDAEVAARLAPPVVTSMRIPDEMRGGVTYTLTWSVLGYHSGYKTDFVLFDCTGQTNCGADLTGPYTHSGKLDPISTETGDWTYLTATSTLFNYSYDYTPPDVDETTNTILRLYQINDDDNGVYPMVSLTISGEIAVEHGNSGRRISNSIIVNPGNLPDTGQTTSYADATGDDADHPRNPQSFTDNGDGTVTDNNTFLMWQQEDDDELYYMDYTESYCTGLSLGGYNDWRVPTTNELISIVNYENSDPSIDETYFPNAGYRHYDIYMYWTSTEHPSMDFYYFTVSFSSGWASYSTWSNGQLKRCVRSEKERALWSSNLVDNSDGTVSDANTELMWQQEILEGSYDWENAISYCENLDLAGFNDWKLPNAKELHTILDYEKEWIDRAKFPDSPEDPVFGNDIWSSTTDASDTSRAIVLSLVGGRLVWKDKTDGWKALKMCVRATHWTDKYEYN